MCKIKINTIFKINFCSAQKAKFAFLVLVDIGQKMVAKCLSFYRQYETRKMALEWWKSFRERCSNNYNNITH
jgi:hypothetical protein